ncbi:MAG TPA: ABC transporter permease [Pseudonocardiaceae bacterium]|jgi:putative ABC transport system permease protein
MRLATTDVLRLGSVGLRTRRLRATLAALGIGIGIAAIVGVLGVSASSEANLLAQLGQLGNLLTVGTGQSFTGDVQPLPDTAVGMVSRIPPVRTVSAVGLVPGATVRRTAAVPKTDNGGLTVVAADPTLPGTLGIGLLSGAFLNPATDRYPAVVLGADAARSLGIAAAAPGVQVYLAGRYFTVVGILAPATIAPEIDDAALIGFPVARSLLAFAGNPTLLYVRTDPDQVSAVQSVLAVTANPAQPEAVQVVRPSDALVARAATRGAFTGLFFGLGAVALLVGGVGIGNVMVISVLERRSEIGLRRALGATRGQVGLQFLTESLILSALGGVVGVLLGAAATAAYALTEHQPIVLPPIVLAIGPGAAIGVGLVAGLWPALRAARLAPTAALRG